SYAATFKIDISSSPLPCWHLITSWLPIHRAWSRFFGTSFATLANSRRKTAQFRCGRTILTQEQLPSRSAIMASASNHNLSEESLLPSKGPIRGAKVWGSVSRSAKLSSKCTPALFVHAARDEGKAQLS